MAARRSSRWTSSTRRAARCARFAPTRRPRFAVAFDVRSSLPVVDRGLPDPRPVGQRRVRHQHASPRESRRAAGGRPAFRMRVRHWPDVAWHRPLQHRDRAARSETPTLPATTTGGSRRWCSKSCPTTRRCASAWRTCRCEARGSCIDWPGRASATTTGAAQARATCAVAQLEARAWLAIAAIVRRLDRHARIEACAVKRIAAECGRRQREARRLRDTDTRAPSDSRARAARVLADLDSARAARAPHRAPPDADGARRHRPSGVPVRERGSGHRSPFVRIWRGRSAARRAARGLARAQRRVPGCRLRRCATRSPISSARNVSPCSRRRRRRRRSTRSNGWRSRIGEPIRRDLSPRLCIRTSCTWQAFSKGWSTTPLRPWERIHPLRTRRQRRFYDLIPLASGEGLPTAASVGWYQRQLASLEALRTSCSPLSEHARAQALARLPMQADRVVVVSAGRKRCLSTPGPAARRRFRALRTSRNHATVPSSTPAVSMRGKTLRT